MPRRAIFMRQAGAAVRQFLDVLTDPRSVIAAVDRLGIARGKLVIEDRANNEEVVYKDLDLAFDKSHGTTNFNLSAEGPSRRWRVEAVARGTPGADRHFKLNVADLSVDELQLAAGTRSLGIETDMPIGMNVDIGLKPDNTLSMAAGDVILGPGFYRLDDPDQEPVFVDRIDAALHWDGATRHIEIDPIDYVAGTTHFKIGGSIVPPLNEGQAWQIRIATPAPGVLGPDRKGQPPVAIDEASLEGAPGTRPEALRHRSILPAHRQGRPGAGRCRRLGRRPAYPPRCVDRSDPRPGRAAALAVLHGRAGPRLASGPFHGRDRLEGRR